jgi:RNA polymerase sigma factor (TIGR02999 family)
VRHSSPVTRDIEQLLAAWRQGDARAADELFQITYQDLRRLARAQLARRRGDQTLATTALVHEVYVRFAERSSLSLVDRQHFLALAARAMRQILVDHVRRKLAAKRGAGLPLPLPVTDAATPPAVTVDLLALDRALDELAALNPRQARVVELRFFAGLEFDEIAELLGVSSRTAKRDWHHARLFLHHSLRSID